MHSHDRMAELVGARVPSFREKYEDLVNNMKRSMLHYVTGLQTRASQMVNNATAEDDHAEVDHAGQMKLTELGFPVLPNPEAWRGHVKKHTEELLRRYLNYHYSTWIPLPNFLERN
jgi:hypothetical protein